MAVRFPLKMKDDIQVRNISELKEHFDIEKVIGYFIDGKLQTWLEARYYEEEAEAVANLVKDDIALAEKLCEIFGVEYVAIPVNTEELEKRNERIALLKQYTHDETILKEVDSVAFNQEELAELYDRGVTKIYLCAGKFSIPKSKRDLEYHKIDDCDVQGLLTKEIVDVEEREEPILEEVVISDKVSIKKDEIKEFKGIKIIIRNEIKCEGVLKFDKCEVVCDNSKISKKEEGYVKTKGFIIVGEKGKVVFNESTILCIGDENNVLITKDTNNVADTKVGFIGCVFLGCEYVLSRITNVYLENCIGVDLQSPFMKSIGHLKMIGCKFEASKKPMAPPDSYEFGNRSKVLIETIGTTEICSSEFVGFVKGVIICQNSVLKIINTRFEECSAIVNGKWTDNTVFFEECKFKKCIHLFEHRIINLKKCEFNRCFGKIEAGKLYLEYCTWNDSLVYLYSNGRPTGISGPNIEMKYCVYKNCDYKDSIKELVNHKSNGYQYYTFMTEGEVEAVFSNMRELISGGELVISVCQFEGIKLENIQYMIESSRGDIRKSTFSNDIIPKSILNKESYTVWGMRFFERDKTYKRYYYIENCKGL